MRQIWSQDPPYDIAGEFWNVQLKNAVIPELGDRLHPKPSRKASADLDFAGKPHSSTARTAR